MRTPVEHTISRLDSQASSRTALRPCPRGWRMARKQYAPRDGQGVWKMELLSATAPVWSVTQPRAMGLFSGRDVYKQGWGRLPDPLSLELVRYTFVSGLVLCQTYKLGLPWQFHQVNQRVQYIITLKSQFDGALASIVDVGLLVGLTRWVGVHYLQAATIAFGCGLITSYILSIAWVFHERKFHNTCFELGLFTLIGGIGLMAMERVCGS
jgi:GtrA-like protein